MPDRSNINQNELSRLSSMTSLSAERSGCFQNKPNLAKIKNKEIKE